MKILNPNYVEPVEARADAIAPKIAQYMASNASKREVTIDELKAAFPEHKSDLVPGLLDHIARKNNWKKASE